MFWTNLSKFQAFYGILNFILVILTNLIFLDLATLIRLTFAAIVRFYFIFMFQIHVFWWFRFKDDDFRITFIHFWSDCHVLRQLGQYRKVETVQKYFLSQYCVRKCLVWKSESHTHAARRFLHSWSRILMFELEFSVCA